MYSRRRKGDCWASFLHTCRVYVCTCAAKIWLASDCSEHFLIHPPPPQPASSTSPIILINSESSQLHSCPHWEVSCTAERRAKQQNYHIKPVSIKYSGELVSWLLIQEKVLQRWRRLSHIWQPLLGSSLWCKVFFFLAREPWSCWNLSSSWMYLPSHIPNVNYAWSSKANFPNVKACNLGGTFLTWAEHGSWSSEDRTWSGVKRSSFLFNKNGRPACESAFHTKAFQSWSSRSTVLLVLLLTMSPGDRSHQTRYLSLLQDLAIKLLFLPFIMFIKKKKSQNLNDLFFLHDFNFQESV